MNKRRWPEAVRRLLTIAPVAVLVAGLLAGVLITFSWRYAYAATLAAYESDCATTWNGANATPRGVCVRGTGFGNAKPYRVSYYDGATSPGLVFEDNVQSSNGSLQSAYNLESDPTAVPGTWRAVVQVPGSENVVAETTFTVHPGAIPEFPSAVAGIVVVGLCAGAYYWMRRQRLSSVRA